MYPRPPVLIVDDDADIRSIVANLLTEEGYETFEAHDGFMALEHIRATPYLLIVICDHMMPGMNGHALLNALLAEPPLIVRDAFIYFTAQDHFLAPELIASLQRLQAPIIHKPFDITDIVNAVSTAAQRLFLDGNREGQPAS